MLLMRAGEKTMKKTSLLVFALLSAFIALGHPELSRSGLATPPLRDLEMSQAGAVARQGTELFYVSPAGNDAWSGKLNQPNSQSIDGPFRTLTRARDTVRRLKASGALTRPVTIYVRGGLYRLRRPLIFGPEDSGTRAAPITYSAYPGEVPVVMGGSEITGWERYAGRRFSPHVPTHMWAARIPAVAQGKWYFHELFVSGKRRTRARSPNAGFFYVDGLISSGTPARFRFHDGDISPQWAKEDDVEVVALQAWAELRMPIRAVDEPARTVTLAGTRQPSNTEMDARYWVENTPEALNAPGEWYLDRKSGWVYYYPMPGEDMSHARVVAPRLQQLIVFEGDAARGRFVSNIELRGLTLSFTDWSLPLTGYADLQTAYDIPAAVYGSGARACSIKESTFVHLGGYAIEFSHGSKDDGIASNEMTDLGAGGVKIGDPDVPPNSNTQTSEITVADNHIRDIGKIYPGAVGIWIGQSGANRIAHNEINDTFYTAISVGWTWGYGPTAANHNIIEFNNLHDIGRGMLSDMGCIYSLGVQPGTVERNNVCRDVSRYKYGGWGIYTDEGSSGIVVEDNVVYRTEDGGFHQHYGQNNIIRNNIFALGEDAQIRRSRREAHLSFTFDHNIVYWKDGKLFEGTFEDNNYRFDDNLYYCVEGKPLQFARHSFAEWRGLGQDAHSIIANPLFLDPERGNFSLDRSSPAFKIGFEPMDLSQVGPRR